MPDETLDSIIEEKLSALRLSLNDAEKTAEILRRENSILRITACGAAHLVEELKSKAFLTEFQTLWNSAPIESVLIYMGALERCLEILSSIAAIKRKQINVTKIKDRDTALVKEAEEYRGKHSPEGHRIAATLNQELTKREKLIKTYAKTLHITYESAAKIIDSMELKAKK